MLYKNLIKILGLLLFLNIIAPERAFAYLDPGTGSMVLQMILAGICGAICTMKLWLHKILNFFKKKEEDDE